MILWFDVMTYLWFITWQYLAALVLSGLLLKILVLTYTNFIYFLKTTVSYFPAGLKTILLPMILPASLLQTPKWLFRSFALPLQYIFTELSCLMCTQSLLWLSSAVFNFCSLSLTLRIWLWRFFPECRTLGGFFFPLLCFFFHFHFQLYILYSLLSPGISLYT